MQNSNGITANEGGGLRELSPDETERVGGGFSWGGLVRGVEHAAGDAANAAAVGFGTVAGSGLAIGTGKLAIKAWKAVENIKLPKAPDEPGPEIPDLPPEIFLG
ncbi:MAG: hypothetical protein WCB02_01755 [Bradyrhizobium sp.]